MQHRIKKVNAKSLRQPAVFIEAEREYGKIKRDARKKPGRDGNGRRRDAPDEAEKRFRSLFNADINTDVIFKRFRTGSGTECLLIYMNGMSDDKTISDFIIRPMQLSDNDMCGEYDRLLNGIVEIPEASIESSEQKQIEAIMDGKTVLFTGSRSSAAVLETRGYEKRGVEKTENERVVRGPKEGFCENLRTNITLLRRIVRTRDLVVNYRKNGGCNDLDLAVAYRKDTAAPELIAEIIGRLSKIDENLIIDTGMIEKLLEEDSLFPLPQMLATERPDRAASFVMHGAAAIFSDGSPYALIVPAGITALMSSPEDSYLRKPLGAMLKATRYVGALIAILLPGYFIALAMHHQGLLSTEVLSTIIKSREMVFEPLPFELLLLLFVFQLIREAGMRVPGSVGQAIGIIGGLILGQAAVAANLASTVTLMIVALSGLGNLCVPDYSTQVACSYFRFVFVIAAWMGGLLGLCISVLLFTAYLADMRSFGVPMMSGASDMRNRINGGRCFENA